MSDVDPREELAELVRGFRAYAERAVTAGAHALPGTRLPEAPPLEPTAAPVETSAGSPAAADASPPVAERMPRTLDDVRSALGDCQRCKLAPQRQKIVFGVGSPNAPLMFIGEAPGAEEDRRGEPFVGAAGQLLDKMILAMGWRRESVYIANVLKCRPPNNRDPQPDEIEACRPFLVRQIECIRPRVIVTLGRPAAHLVLDTTAPISALRGKWQEFRGVRVMPTFHPAFLLRQPQRKRDAWSDLQLVMAELERLDVHPPRSPAG